MSLLMQKINLTNESQKRKGFFLKIEELQLATFLTLCRKIKADTFFDIGANVGFYTLVARKYIEFDCHAFEPSLETYNQLRQNINLNFLGESVSIYNLALSSIEGITDFIVFSECSGMNSIAQTSIHNPTKAIDRVSVKLNKLDNLFHYTNRRLVFKVDTEGHELNVLRGGEALLSGNSCFIQVETGHGNKCRNEVIDFLGYLGYRLVFSLGPDDYFTNISYFFTDEAKFTILQESMNAIVDLRWDIDFKNE